jgi:multidrug resistance efflux pump
VPLSNKINLVKQQKEQLQHQLQMAVPKPFSGGIPSKLVAASNDASSRSRLIKGTSNENLDDDTANVTKINKNYSYSNESLENLETTNLNTSQNQAQQRNKYVPIGKRIVLNPSDVINSNTGK